MAQLNLRFLNPVHEPGENATVRLGDKWHKLVHPGDIIKVTKTGEEDKLLGFAVIKKTHLCPFGSIPQDLLAKEHDPSCMTMEGLTLAMKRAYGNAFCPSCRVTVVVYDFQPMIPQFLSKIIADMIEERGYEETMWTQEFDDQNTLNDWTQYVNTYMARAAQYGNRNNVQAQRKGLLKALTLLVSAIHTCDLNNGFAPRHYEDVALNKPRPH